MMTDRTDDFFIPDNEIRLPDELDYSRVDEYIRSAEAFSRSSYQSVYIIDYFRQNFLYVSPNPMFLCGLSPERVKGLGYRFYLDFVPEDEQPMLLTLNKAGFAFYNDIPVDERKGWYISYDFHIFNEGKKILVNHKLTPLALTPHLFSPDHAPHRAKARMFSSKSPYVSDDKPRAFGGKHAGFRKRSRDVAEKKARGSEKQLRPLNFRKSALDKK